MPERSVKTVNTARLNELSRYLDKLIVISKDVCAIKGLNVGAKIISVCKKIEKELALDSE